MNKLLTTLILSLLLIGSMATQASSYDKSNWYFSLDLEQVRNTIVPLIPKNTEAKNSFKMNEHLPAAVMQVTAYGHSEAENDLSLILSGDFTDFEVNDYIRGLMYSIDADEQVNIGLFDAVSHNGSLVEHFQVTGDGQTKSFYSAKISNQMIVVSFEQAEVMHWIDQKYSRYDLRNSGMVSLLINIDSAMAHMGADLKSNSKPFNSAVFKKITQFSASLYEADESIVVDAALSTADVDTAKQLEQVINGLIAMNALSNLDQDKPLLSALLSGLNISNQGSDLLISTGFALSLIPQLDIN